MIVLTARDEVDDTIAGLDSGADDYVTKPFVFEELLARVRARLRGGERTASTRLELRGGGLRLDLRSRRVEVGDRMVELTVEGVRAAGDVPRAPRPGAQPRAVALAGLGLRLRPGLQRRRRLRRLPAPQAGRRALRDDPRNGVPDSAIDVRELSRSDHVDLTPRRERPPP